MTNKCIGGKRASYKKKVGIRKSLKIKLGSQSVNDIIAKGAHILSNESYKKSIHNITKPAFIRKSYRRRTINRKI